MLGFGFWVGLGYSISVIVVVFSIFPWLFRAQTKHWQATMRKRHDMECTRWEMLRDIFGHGIHGGSLLVYQFPVCLDFIGNNSLATVVKEKVDLRRDSLVSRLRFTKLNRKTAGCRRRLCGELRQPVVDRAGWFCLCCLTIRQEGVLLSSVCYLGSKAGLR